MEREEEKFVSSSLTFPFLNRRKVRKSGGRVSTSSHVVSIICLHDWKRVNVPAKIWEGAIVPSSCLPGSEDSVIG